jgi:hypothetical protein
MRRLSCLASVVLLCLLAIFTVVPAAFAVTAPYSLEATSLAPWEWSDFSVSWTDNNHDGQFQASELETGGFSGVTYLPFAWFYERLEAVPVQSSQSPYTGGTALEWSFVGPMGSMTADPSMWSYTSDAAQAPIPASALLMGSGLAGLGLLGWRRKRS